jgi:hypothetical protein
MEAMTASSTWAVQMLDVARSRLIPTRSVSMRRRWMPVLRARRLEQGQRERVRHRNHHAAGGVHGLDQLGQVTQRTVRGLRSDQHPAAQLTGRHLREVREHERDTHGLGPGLHHGERLGVDAGVHHERLGDRLPVRATQHHHRLGGGGALVEQGGVGGAEPGQVGDGGLEVQQRLQPAL